MERQKYAILSCGVVGVVLQIRFPNCAAIPSYHHRSPLEHTLFGPFPRLVLVCINADFYEQGRIFQHFSSSTFFPLHHSRFLWFFRTFAPFLQNFTQFLLTFTGGSRFCSFSSKFSGFLSEFRRISMIFERVMSKFSYFKEIWENLLNFAKFWRKIAENLSEKMYALNP